MRSCMIFYGDQMTGHVRKYHARTDGISQLTKGTSPLQVIQKTIWLVLYFGEENIKNRLKLIFGEISKKSSMDSTYTKKEDDMQIFCIILVPTGFETILGVILVCYSVI